MKTESIGKFLTGFFLKVVMPFFPILALLVLVTPQPTRADDKFLCEGRDFSFKFYIHEGGGTVDIYPGAWYAMCRPQTGKQTTLVSQDRSGKLYNIKFAEYCFPFDSKPQSYFYWNVNFILRPNNVMLIDEFEYKQGSGGAHGSGSNIPCTKY